MWILVDHWIDTVLDVASLGIVLRSLRQIHLGASLVICYGM